MKPLVIHIRDASTDFLCKVYRNCHPTLVRESLPVAELIALIQTHDRVVMLGHGTSGGLFGSCGMIVNQQIAPYLAGKDNIYIWCHASSFVQEHGLSGFASGMFVSEVDEARLCGLGAVSQGEVTRSNNDFATLVGDQITQSSAVIYDYCRKHYCGKSVAQYNWERLVVAKRSVKTVGRAINPVRPAASSPVGTRGGQIFGPQPRENNAVAVL